MDIGKIIEGELKFDVVKVTALHDNENGVSIPTRLNIELFANEEKIHPSTHLYFRTKNLSLTRATSYIKHSIRDNAFYLSNLAEINAGVQHNRSMNFFGPVYIEGPRWKKTRVNDCAFFYDAYSLAFGLLGRDFAVAGQLSWRTEGKKHICQSGYVPREGADG